MNSMAGRIAAIGLTALAAICPQETAADGFTGADFANWSQISQDSFIQTSLTMAGVVGTQVKPEISRCLDRWYFADPSAKARIDDEIRGFIIQYADSHPSGVILAVLQRECGMFAD